VAGYGAAGGDPAPSKLGPVTPRKSVSTLAIVSLLSEIQSIECVTSEASISQSRAILRSDARMRSVGATSAIKRQSALCCQHRSSVFAMA
jgi:hypothetical protein